jgi:hypothetical protein
MITSAGIGPMGVGRGVLYAFGQVGVCRGPLGVVRRGMDPSVEAAPSLEVRGVAMYQPFEEGSV